MKVKYKCKKCCTINEFEPNLNFDVDLVDEDMEMANRSYDECSSCGALHEVGFTLSYIWAIE